MPRAGLFLLPGAPPMNFQARMIFISGGVGKVAMHHSVTETWGRDFRPTLKLPPLPLALASRGPRVGASLLGQPPHFHPNRMSISNLPSLDSGGRIRTGDLVGMGHASYRAAPLRDL